MTARKSPETVESTDGTPVAADAVEAVKATAKGDTVRLRVVQNRPHPQSIILTDDDNPDADPIEVGGDFVALSKADAARVVAAAPGEGFLIEVHADDKESENA